MNSNNFLMSDVTTSCIGLGSEINRWLSFGIIILFTTVIRTGRVNILLFNCSIKEKKLLVFDDRSLAKQFYPDQQKIQFQAN